MNVSQAIWFLKNCMKMWMEQKLTEEMSPFLISISEVSPFKCSELYSYLNWNFSYTLVAVHTCLGLCHGGTSANLSWGVVNLPEAGDKSGITFPGVCFKAKAQWFITLTSLFLHSTTKVWNILQTSQHPTLVGVFSVLYSQCFCLNMVTTSQYSLQRIYTDTDHFKRMQMIN